MIIFNSKKDGLVSDNKINLGIIYLLIGQWVIYWNDNKHPGNEIIFTAEAGFTKCPTEIEAKKWKFSFAWGRFIKSIKCA